MTRTKNHRPITLLGAAWRGLVLAVLTALESEATDSIGSAQPTTRWVQIEHELGSMRLDGTLKYSVLLGEGKELKQLGLRLELEHAVEVDADGLPRSAWRVRGLSSSLAPSGREQLRWQSLTGTEHLFERAKIGRAFSATDPARWMIREPRSGKFEIRSREGWVWQYARGTLTGIDHPILGPLRVSTQGAWITRVESSDALAGGHPLLQASYSKNGRLQTLQIGGLPAQQLVWSEAGELVTWLGVDGRKTYWTYKHNLLSEIADSGKPVRNILWRENSGYWRGDSRWLAPVHLAAFDNDQYDYELTRRGFLLSRKSVGSRAKVVTLFNPGLRRLEQDSGGERLIVKFRRGSGGRGALERIETADGKILEEYLYDGTGRLGGIKRAGQPLIQLDYDDHGRLIAVDGGRTP
jgi:YD repeat-containing protein